MGMEEGGGGERETWQSPIVKQTCAVTENAEKYAMIGLYH